MKEIEVKLTDFEIEPKEIKVPIHEPIRLLVINYGSMERHFIVEAGQSGIQLENLKPGQTKALEHIFTELGSFRTTCRYGQNEGSVCGWLVVEA